MVIRSNYYHFYILKNNNRKEINMDSSQKKWQFLVTYDMQINI